MERSQLSIATKIMAVVAMYVVLLISSHGYLNFLINKQSTLITTRLDNSVLVRGESNDKFVKKSNSNNMTVIKADIKSKNFQILVVSFVDVVLTILFALTIFHLLRRIVTHPLMRLQLGIRQVERDSDLNGQLPVHSNDEIGNACQAFNKMLDRFREIIRQVADASTRLSMDTSEAKKVTEETSQSILQQQSDTERVAQAIQEMSGSVQEVARNTSCAADLASVANTEANNGQKVVAHTIEGINLLAEEVKVASEVIQKLAIDSNNIGAVLNVIKDISEQTNLLALNAAIEAARAGEQGRGFAVVADEVRTLAQRTNESTQEIKNMIERLQTAASEAVEVMEAGRARAEAGVEQALKAGDSLDRITDAVEQINDLNRQIASAAEQQSLVAGNINESITNISRVTSRTAEGAKRTNGSNDDISKLAVHLQSLVTQFKIDNPDADRAGLTS